MTKRQGDASHTEIPSHRGTGFAGPQVAPPEGEAPKALRGGTI